MPAARKLTVMVVDDQLTMRSLVRASLQQIGVNDVREYAGGAEALRNLKARPANVVISDYNMPEHGRPRSSSGRSAPSRDTRARPSSS